MANIGFKLIGRGKFTARLNRITNSLAGSSNNELFKAISKGGEIIRSDAVKSISKGSRTGNVYNRGKNGEKHVASAQGEFPKTDTGELIRNITVERAGRYAVEVGSRIQAPQGYWLETKEPSQGGRPWLAPTFNKNIDRVQNIIAKTVKKVVEKG